MTDSFTTASATSQPRSPRTIAVDNFLRKTLRIGDPRDPEQVAGALLQMYPAEADRVRRESDGLAYATWADPIAPAASGGVAAMAELAQAQDDLERDARTLIDSSQLKDIRVELTGWGRAVRRLADDGLAAARIALDSVQFDRALAARAQLVSYARLARYVGTISEDACSIFRRFAQSCDTLASLILVAIGEGLAGSGITRGTSLVRISASELQSRRNAVIGALRALTAAVDSSLGQDDWPWGLEGFRALAQRLDESGQADLRALLEETTLAQALDELVNLSAGGNVEGLRELSTTSALLVHRLERLVQAAQSTPVPAAAAATAGAPESPPLAAFSSALQLFMDAFSGNSGNRLLYIARPPIVIYGLYGAAGPDAGARRLIDLTMARGSIAELVDCLACCECSEDVLRCQILADFMLYLLDRAIDAYAVGSDPAGRGSPEARAAAYGLLIENAMMMVARGGNKAICKIDPRLLRPLRAVTALLLDPFAARRPKMARKLPARMTAGLQAELNVAYFAEERTESLVRALSPACHTRLFSAVRTSDGELSIVRALIRRSLLDLKGTIGLAAGSNIPPPLESSVASIAHDRPAFASQ